MCLGWYRAQGSVFVSYASTPKGILTTYISPPPNLSISSPPHLDWGQLCESLCTLPNLRSLAKMGQGCNSNLDSLLLVQICPNVYKYVNCQFTVAVVQEKWLANKNGE